MNCSHGPAAATILISMPLPSKGEGVSYTCSMIARNMGGSASHVRMFTPYSTERPTKNHDVINTLRPISRLFPFRYNRTRAITIHEARFLKAVEEANAKGYSVAYMWPDPSLSLLRRLRETGAPIVREMINCHRATAKKLLDAEYNRLGLAPTHTISEQSIEFEHEALKLCDYIFCSNPLAERSVIDDSIPPSKVQAASFGWDPARFVGDAVALKPVEGSTFIFTGYICIRKGVHLLLRYWAKSGIRGRLVLVGEVEPAVKKLCAQQLARDDVSVLSYRRDLGPLYRSADVFVFPSIEEGGPQVTYEAAGCALPLLVSPMGAARIADTKTGFVVEPLDESGWIEAMRTLAADAEMRRAMASEARDRSLRFTWRKVAEARRAALQGIAAGAPAMGPLASPSL